MKKQKEKEVMWEGKKLHTNEPFTPSLEGGGHGPWIYKKSPTPSSSLYIYTLLLPSWKRKFLDFAIVLLIIVFFSKDLSSCSVLNSINKWWFHWKKKKKNQIMWLVSVRGWNVVGDILPNLMRGHCNFPIKKKKCNWFLEHWTFSRSWNYLPYQNNGIWFWLNL